MASIAYFITEVVTYFASLVRRLRSSRFRRIDAADPDC
jgi:hypothetical protein